MRYLLRFIASVLKKIIEICHALGFCSAYKKARLYEASAVFQVPSQIKPGTFVQFVHDNSDFNVDTIDGKGTFHNLGSISIITPGDGLKPREPLKRFEEIPSESEVIQKVKD